MEPHELAALISKTAALMEQFERRCEGLERHQREIGGQLQQLAQQLPAVVRQAADQSLGRIPDAVTASVRSGLEQPVGAYEKRLRDAGGLLQGRSQTLALQLEQMQWLHRQLMWKVTATVLGSLLLLLVGGAWLTLQYRNDIRHHQISADLLRAYNRADVLLCEGRLCANVETQGKPYGERGQYRVVHSRRVPAAE